jgi:hypothetical protein
MIKRLIFVAPLLFVALPANAGAPTILQHKSNFAASGSSVSASFGAAVTAGNMIVACIGSAHDSNTINTPTMTGETFANSAGASNAGSATHGQTKCYTVNSAAGGQTQVTVTVTSSNTDVHLHIFEINGQVASPIDATGNTESTTLSVSTSASTTTANDLVIGFFYDFATNRAFSAGSGYSQVEQTNDSTGGDSALSESKTVSATGTQTATASGNSGDTCEQGIIAIAGTGAAAPSGGMNKREKLEQIDPPRRM